ncbi:GDPD domain containing protein [Trichuris trichiura]|uniref:GDPD domain containing protein n=1 Tax=Trichuris trichiura TaxID=36087 RepID=A0A077Z5F6_TRITR|nr:GDPD domain containing protein [Trichuris trichiura]
MAHHRPDFPTTVDRIEFKTPLNIGHRGMAEFVEFDVQLTKDEIPIVFHDFHVRLLAKRRRKGTSSPIVGPLSDWEMHTVMVNSLTLKDLRSLKMEHAMAESNFLRGYSSVTNDDEPIEEDQPFPTLEQVFKSLPPSLGFNIEVKYPQKMESDPEGAQYAIERNLYMDRILEIVFKLADQRSVIFSSFDPDICLMIQLKQNKYPVLFLTQGDSRRYERYADVRMQSSKVAIHFAHSNGLLGVAFHSEEILRDSTLLPLARSLHLTSFVWGNDLDSAQMVEHFRKLGFDGVIYDQ